MRFARITSPGNLGVQSPSAGVIECLEKLRSDLSCAIHGTLTPLLVLLYSVALPPYLYRPLLQRQLIHVAKWITSKKVANAGSAVIEI